MGIKGGITHEKIHNKNLMINGTRMIFAKEKAILKILL